MIYIYSRFNMSKNCPMKQVLHKDLNELAGFGVLSKRSHVTYQHSIMQFSSENHTKIIREMETKRQTTSNFTPTLEDANHQPPTTISGPCHCQRQAMCRRSSTVILCSTVGAHIQQKLQDLAGRIKPYEAMSETQKSYFLINWYSYGW